MMRRMPRARRRTIIIASAVLFPVLIAVGFLVYQFVYIGAPLWDEWRCSKGEAPVEFHDGGTGCMSKGRNLPAGASWDPLGNRPFSCDGRRGWAVIHRGDDEDCLRDGLRMPDGWSEGALRR
jgi:hypothetical protein